MVAVLNSLRQTARHEIPGGVQAAEIRQLAAPKELQYLQCLISWFDVDTFDWEYGLEVAPEIGDRESFDLPNKSPPFGIGVQRAFVRVKRSC